MRRRDFFTLIGGAAAGWPLAARAQQSVPVIGLLNGVSLDSFAERIAAFRQGLKESGFIEGQNLIIEYRAADGRYEQLPALAAELVRRRVALIVAIGSSMSARAAKAATTDIPIVFALGADPVGIGLVSSMSRPIGNLTGVTNFATMLAAKRLELLCEIKPDATVIAYIVNSRNLVSEADARDIVSAARAIGREIVVFPVGTEQEIDAAMTTVAEQKISAVIFQGDALFANQAHQIVKLAERHAIPAMHATRESVVAGGLISYSPDNTVMFRMAGVYAGSILKGAKPTDLPVLQPTKFELIVNLKAAKAIGLTIPESFLLRADEVIE
jgi:putative ABC transport system substrate-binding protein